MTGLENGDTEDVISYEVVREEGEAAGEYEITIDGPETLDNYNVVYVPSTFTITKAALTVTADNKSKVYGAEDPELTWAVEGLAGQDTKEILNDVVTVERESGEDVNENGYVITPSGAEEIDNYTITYLPGTFKITVRPVTFTAGSSTDNIFNASEVVVDKVDAEEQGEASGLITGHTYEVEFDVTDEGKPSNKRTLVGEQDVVIKSVTIKDADGNDVTANYDPKFEKGEIIIKDRGEDAYKLTISSPDVPSVYNGYEQSYTIVAGVETVESKNPVESALDFISSVIKNFFTIVAGAEDGDVEFTVTDDGKETTYVLHNAKVTATGTDAGDYPFAFDEKPTITTNIDGKDEDVTKQFDITEKLGSLQIDRAPITITVDNATKVQGAADPTFTGTVEGLLGTDTLDISYIRKTGEAVGSYDITPDKSKEVLESENKNYSFEIIPGTFTITAPTPGPTPPTPDPDPTPTTPVTIPDAPAPTAPTPAAQAVLGARREEPTSGQAVLGARRARTEDTTNEATRVFAIILAAATAVTLLLTGKKKKEEEEG